MAMNAAGIAVALLRRAESIAPVGDLPVKPLPERQAEGNVQQRGQPPEPAQAAGKISNGRRAAVTFALPIDDVHLLHHHVVRQVGVSAGHFGIVQGQIRQLVLTIPPGELANLRRADAAIAVVDDDIGVGPLVGGGEGNRLACGCRHSAVVPIYFGRNLPEEL